MNDTAKMTPPVSHNSIGQNEAGDLSPGCQGASFLQAEGQRLHPVF